MCSGPEIWLLICVINLAPGTGKFNGKESACQCRRQRRRFNPQVGRIPWRRKWQPAPVFSAMDRGAWWATDHGVAKSWTWLSDWAHTHRHVPWPQSHTFGILLAHFRVWDEGLGSCSLFCCLNMFLQVKAIPFFTQMCTLYQWFLNLTMYGITWRAG